MIENLQELLIQESIFNYTKENTIKNKIPFLDVLVDASNPDNYCTSVYTKPTKTDESINFKSEAPQRCKTGVVKILLSRAWKKSLNRNRIKRLLVNNEFPKKILD